MDNEWRRGWPVLAAAISGLALGSVYTFSFGAFVGPIENEFGWSRAQISLGLTVITFTASTLTPLVGIYVDKWGPRTVGLIGALSFAATFGLLGTATSNIWTWWGLWFLLAFTFIAVKPMVWTSSVAFNFTRNRGLALAIALCGSGLSSTFVPAYATWAIDSFGWRLAYPILALSIGIGIFPILFFGLRNGRPDGSAPGRDKASWMAARNMPAVRAAIFSASCVKLALAAFFFTLATMGIIPNLIPILESHGIGRPQAAAIAGTAGIASIVGRLVTGSLLDRYNPRIVSAAVVLFPVASCLLLLGARGDITLSIVAIVLMGAALGSEVDVIAFMTARQFGMARYGTLFGLITAFWGFATGIGPVVANHIYDVTKGYGLALQAAVPLYVVTSLLLLTLGKPLVLDDGSGNPTPPANA